MRKLTGRIRLKKNFFLMATLFMFSVIDFILPTCSSALIGLKEGDLPKEVILEDINGAKIDVTEFFGKKPVILVFWKLMTNKEFLDYSLDELIFLRDFHEQHHEKAGLQIFGIYTPEEEKEIPESEIQAVQQLIKTSRISFPVLIDKGFRTFKEYGVIALPSTIMIDKTGKIKYIYPSFPVSAQAVIAEQIMDLIGAKTVHSEKDIKTTKVDTGSNRFYQYALQMYRRGLPEQAVSPLKKSMDMEQAYPWSHNLMGIIFSQRGNFEESANEFRQAIKLDKDNAAAHFNYGLLLYEHEKYDEAEQYLKKSILINKALAKAHYVLGLLYIKTDRQSEALNELKTALSLFDKNRTTSINEPLTYYRISTIYMLSDLYSRQGEDKEALSLLQLAAQIALGIEDKAVHGSRKADLMIYE